MSRSRDLANLANNASGLETLTVSDITDLTASATELNKLDGVTKTTSDLNSALTGGTRYTYSDLTLTMLNNFVAESTSDWCFVKLGNLVFCNFVVYEDSASLSAASTYDIFQITSPTALRPSSDQKMFTNSLAYQSETAQSLTAKSDGKYNIQSPIETGDSVHRVSYNCWYSLP